VTVPIIIDATTISVSALIVETSNVVTLQAKHLPLILDIDAFYLLEVEERHWCPLLAGCQR